MTQDQVVFGVLGPLQVRYRSALTPTRTTKREVLLATLLLEANRVVGTGLLIDTLWKDPPRSAVANVQTYISGLRAALSPARTGPRIRTDRGGYQLLVEPGELDLAMFQALTADAQRLQTMGRPDSALIALDRALDLWRGAPLADLPLASPWQPHLDRIAALRREAVERRLRLHLGQGSYAPATAELRVLLAEDPFQEELWRLLLVALTASRQPAAALATYRQAHDLFIRGLGIEPGAGLRQAHETILRGGPLTLDPPPADPAAPVPRSAPQPGTARSTGIAPRRRPWPVCQLPRDLCDFTGRQPQIAQLAAALRSDLGCPVAVVTGQPGIGKTALAVRTGHLLKNRFPDGQLYLDLAGSGTDPPPPVAALGELLRTLGITEVAQPASTAARAALLRSLLAGQRVLIVLDDAHHEDQVSPLLPATSGCAVVLTSRHRLPGLPGTYRLDLAELSSPEANQLLGALAGARRTADEPAALRAVVEACGRHPLAVRVAGARLGSRPDWPVRELAARLADEPGRLDELRTGRLTVRESFASAVRTLPEAAGRALRLIGQLDCEDLPGWLVESLVDTPQAPVTLDTLVDTNLIQAHGVDAAGQPRYRLSTLLRCYLRDSAGRDAAAVSRTLGTWLALADHAADQLPACVFRAAAGAAPRSLLAPGVADAVGARPLAWFDVERQNLLRAIESAGDSGHDELAWELALAVMTYLDHRGRLDEWRRSHSAALGVVRSHGNRRGEAALLRGLGQIELYLDAYAPAYRTIDESRRISRRIGDSHGEATAVAGLAAVERVVGRHDRALRHYELALSTFIHAKNDHATAHTYTSIGTVLRAAGVLDRSREWLLRAARLAFRIGDEHRLAGVLGQLGELHLAERQSRRAVRTLRQAVRMFEGLEDDRCMACALQSLARALRGCDEVTQAAPALHRAIEIFRRMGDRQNEAQAVEELGRLHRGGGHEALAHRHLARAAQLRAELAPAAVLLVNRAT